MLALSSSWRGRAVVLGEAANVLEALGADGAQRLVGGVVGHLGERTSLTLLVSPRTKCVSEVLCSQDGSAIPGRLAILYVACRFLACGAKSSDASTGTMITPLGANRGSGMALWTSSDC